MSGSISTEPTEATDSKQSSPTGLTASGQTIRTSISQSSSLFDRCLSLIWESDYRKSRAIQFVKKDRVFQVSATSFAVEARKYLKTLKKPSKLHIVQRRLNAKPYELACDCYYAGYDPSPFNACAHVLACLLAQSLKDGDTSLLVMRDVDRKKKQQQELEQAQTVGNEYPDHYTQKQRVGKILKDDGWIGVFFEQEVQCDNPHTGIPNKYPFVLDVYATNYINGRYHKIGVEVNREKTGGGHGSKITIPKDRNRAQDIEDQHKIKVIAFNVDHLKNSEDEDILQEIYQAIK